jgi:hypothetical protein
LAVEERQREEGKGRGMRAEGRSMNSERGTMNSFTGNWQLIMQNEAKTAQLYVKVAGGALTGGDEK